MKEDYTDIIQQVSQVVFEAIKDREENQPAQVKDLDGELAKLLRLVGREVMSMCLNETAEIVTNESKKKGIVVHRREKIKYSVIFGVIEVNSPYLWHKQQHLGIRPVVEKLGIQTGDRSMAVKRALTDFGSEESFGQAAKRFQEHYSSHRYIPQKRLKIPGATWHPNTINPMLALRVIRANDWWNDFWQTSASSANPLIA